MSENKNSSPFPPELPSVQLMSYGFDYDTNEIVARIEVGEGDYRTLRLCEKDTKRMAEWFDLAVIIKRKNELEALEKRAESE